MTLEESKNCHWAVSLTKEHWMGTKLHCVRKKAATRKQNKIHPVFWFQDQMLQRCGFSSSSWLFLLNVSLLTKTIFADYTVSNGCELTLNCCLTTELIWIKYHQNPQTRLCILPSLKHNAITPCSLQDTDIRWEDDLYHKSSIFGAFQFAMSL